VFRSKNGFMCVLYGTLGMHTGISVARLIMTTRPEYKSLIPCVSCIESSLAQWPILGWAIHRVGPATFALNTSRKRNVTPWVIFARFRWSWCNYMYNTAHNQMELISGAVAPRFKW